jgi:hypothetical protein
MSKASPIFMIAKKKVAIGKPYVANLKVRHNLERLITRVGQ